MRTKFLVMSVFIFLCLLVSCQAPGSTPTTTSGATTSSTTFTEKPSTTNIVTTSTPSSTITTNPAVSAKNWWDKFGSPQYGGGMTVHDSMLRLDTDPHSFFIGARSLYWDVLFNRDWTVDRSIEPFVTEFVAPKYYKNGLAKTWEQTDPTTITITLVQGALWQNKAPLNGREITAYDVEYTYARILGNGHGFTKKNPLLSGFLTNVDQVIAKDKYTVIFKFKTPSFWAMYDVFGGGFGAIAIIAPELVEQNKLADWHDAVGSGAYMLTDYISGSSITYNKNPNYWAHDERYPQNQLPYIEKITEIKIADISTVLAAIRTGKIDILQQMNFIPLNLAQQLMKDNTTLQEGFLPTPGPDIHVRFDKVPFNDIKVRQALQMSLDLRLVAKQFYYGSISGDPEGLLSPTIKGFTIPYSQWPSDLQAEYTYDLGKARNHMTSANYPNGFTTQIVASNADDINLLQILKAQFNEIGVDMTINVTDPATLKTYIGRYDGMYYSAYSGVTQSPLSCLARLAPDSGLGFQFNNDQNYISLLSQLRKAANETEAKQVSQQLDLYILKQHWMIFTYGTRSPIFWQEWVKGNSGEAYVYTLINYYYPRYWIDQSLKK